MKPDISAAAALIKGARRVLLATHLQPDGDAIGSVLALGSLLKQLGKETVILCQDPVPENLHFLPGWEQVASVTEFASIQEHPFDLSISVDASDYARLGDCGPLFLASPLTLKIDHHATNGAFAQESYVDEDVAASGVLIYRFFEALGVAITRDVAIYLYTALSTDTGNFSFGKMTEELFAQMAVLMKADLPIAAAARQLHLVKQPAYIRLLTRALDSLVYLAGGRLTRTLLRGSDFSNLDANMEHAEGIVNFGLNIQGVKATFLATETPEGVKFSLRSLPPYDVSLAAAHFGGGGHVLAAGCTIEKPFDEAVALMSAYLEGMFT
ncbi:MAG: bifunctional oligoribonuclease/PAP phosphatase NrnA [Eubacteriales bacterium]|nr:bifunctional oligoribonuclease/PAP phosphatase NrnA [Eubacteriales bacterium]